MARLAYALAILAACTAPVSAVWPMPTTYGAGSSTLALAPSFHIDLAVPHAAQDLQDAVKATEHLIKADKLARLVVGRGAGDTARVQKAKALKSLKVSFAKGAKGTGGSISAEAVKPVEKRDEAYELSVPADGSAATLTAASALGLYRGLTTFQQLWYTHGESTYTVEAPYKISDKPAYPYRGLMLDTARNYFPVSDIKRTLDAMALVKLNTFHWHVVDSQSFPLVVPGFTEIAAKGAYSADRVYSVKDVKDVVTYAAARGIDVIPEIDTPGHTAIIAESHPEHIACPDSRPWASFANEPPAGQLRFADKKTATFAANLLSAASKLFQSSYFSTGGDELNAHCYAVDAQTQHILNSTGQTFEQALSTFTQGSHAALRKNGKSAVVWEEMVLEHNVTLAADTVVLVWISSQNAKAVAQKGFKFVQAPSDYFYLDCGMGGWVGDFPDGQSWCSPFKTWQHAYSFDPVANLTASEAKLVLGGQQLLWAEQSSPENVDPQLWPRAAASAELFWSGPPKTNVSEALTRLHDISYRMRRRGIKAIALQPEWCAIRPHACDLTA